MIRHASRLCTVLMATIAVGSLSGCGSSGDSGSESTTKGNVRVDNRWPSTTIPVCWVNPTSADAVQRGWARSAVEREYEGKTSFRFSGWSSCDGVYGSAIRVKINDTRGWSYIGRSSANPSMVVSLARVNYASYCRKSPSLHRRCVEATVLHEFGHAIGLYHEQDRDDSTCHNGRDASSGTPIGLYDPHSIMNYCKDTVADPHLTASDVRAIQYIARLTRPSSNALSARSARESTQQDAAPESTQQDAAPESTLRQY